MSVLQTVTGGVSGSNSLDLSIASTTAGSCLFLGVFSFSTGTAAAPTTVEAGSTAFTLQGTPYQGENAGILSLYALNNNAGALTSITIDQAGTSNTGLSAVLIEVTGIWLYGTILDQQSAGDSTETNAWSSAATATTTSPNEFAIGLYGGWENQTYSPAGPGGSWVNTTPVQEDVGEFATYLMLGYQSLSSEEAVTYSGTGGSINYWNTGKVWTFYEQTPDYPAIVGTASTDKSATSSSIAVNLPAGILAGDLLLAYIACDNYTSNFSSTGWTAFDSGVEVGTKSVVQGFYKTASGTEGSSATFNINSGSHFETAVSIGFRGAIFDPGVPANSGTANATASETIKANSITTTSNDDYLLWVGMIAAGTGAGVPTTITPPTGYTIATVEGYFTESTVSNAELFLGVGALASAGASGVKDGSVTTAYPSLGALIGISAGIPQVFSGSPSLDVGFSLNCTGEGVHSGSASTGTSYTLSATGSKRITENVTAGPVTFSTAGSVGTPAGSGSVTLAINFRATAAGNAIIPANSTTVPIHPILSPFYAYGGFRSGVSRTARPPANLPYPSYFGAGTLSSPIFTLSATGAKHGTGSPVATVNFVFASTLGQSGQPIATINFTATAAGVHHGNTGALTGTAVVNLAATAAGASVRNANPTLLKNPGFELGSTTAWEAVTGTLAISSVHSHSGTYSGLVTLSSGTGNVYPSNGNNSYTPLTSGDQYEFSVWVYAPSGFTGNPYVEVYFNTSAQDLAVVKVPLIANQWVHAYTSFTATSTNEAAPEVFIEANGGSLTEAWVDDAYFALSNTGATLGVPTFSLGVLRLPLDLGGTELDTNEYGGSATGTNLLGGTVTDSNLLGGTVTDANQLGYESLVQWEMAEVDIELLPEFNDETLDFTITNYGVALNLAPYTVQVVFKAADNTPDADAAFTLSSVTSGLTITNAAAGEITIQIPNADMDTLDIGFYRIDIIDGHGNLNTAIFGNVTILPM